MSHNLKKNLNGEIAMMYDQEAGIPWHELGTPMTGRFTPEECQRVFPFTVEMESVFLADGTLVPNFKSVTKLEEGTRQSLAIMGENYSPMQPFEALNIISELNLECDTALALGNGEIIIVNCIPPELAEFEVIKNDPIKPYIMFCTSYDGSHAREIRNTAIRTVCQNTFRMAIKEDKPFFSIKNTRNADVRTKVGVEMLKQYLSQAGSFKAILGELARHPINDELVNQFMDLMFGDPSLTPAGRASTILENKRDKFQTLLVTGKGTEIPGVVGSAYGMLNAYVEWSDFYSAVRGSKDRTNSILFGQGAELKDRAAEVIMDLVGVTVNR